MTYLPKRVLLGAGLASTTISAVFMSATLYSLMPGGWSYLGLLIGVILESVKSSLSYEAASSYIPDRRYGAFVGAVLIICAVMLFSTWAGNERLIHSVAADEKQGQALRGTRSEQITAELASIDAQLVDLSRPFLMKAETEHEREMLKGLQTQAKSMRDRMALTKAAELESGPIANLLATIERKEESVAADNRREADRRQALERDLRAKVSSLHAEQVEIASRTSKIESSNTEVTYLILKLIVLVIEGLPIYIFFVYGKPSVAAAMARKTEVTQVEGSEPIAQEPRQIAPQAAPVVTFASVSHSAEVIEDSTEDPIQISPQSTPVSIAEQVHEEPAVEVSVAPATDSEVAVEPTAAVGVDALPAFSHPQLDQVSAQVKALKSGESVSQDWLKKTFKLGGDTAKRFTDYLSEIGLITKTSRGWVRA